MVFQTGKLPVAYSQCCVQGNFEEDLLPTTANFEYTWYRYVSIIFAFVPNSMDFVDFSTRISNL